MTREEAKAILIDKVKPCLNGTDWEYALDMAIKALEQEPCEDAISREQVIKELSKLVEHYTLEFIEENSLIRDSSMCGRMFGAGASLDIVKTMPSVRPKVKTGK